MKRSAIVALALTACACQHLMTGLSVLQDPATQTLITDIRILLDRLSELNNTPAETETAQEAIAEQKAIATEAITELVDQLDAEGNPKAAQNFRKDLEKLSNGPS